MRFQSQKIIMTILMIKPDVLQDESPESADVPVHDEPAAATDKAQT